MTRTKSLSYTLLKNVRSALCSEKIFLHNNDFRVCLVAVCKSSLSDFVRIIPPFLIHIMKGPGGGAVGKREWGGYERERGRGGL